MLLKVHLPASIPPIPRMSLSMNDVDLTLSALPSSSTILLSMVAVFVLLSFVRALFIGLREHLAFVRGRKAQQDTKVYISPSSPASVKSTSTSASAEVQPQRATSSWLWGLVKWDTLPSFPLEAPSLQSPNVSGGIGRGAGVGMSEKQGWFHVPQSQQQAAARRPPVVSIRRPGPAFERPLPTLYQSDMPVSMAKMIMSRHTFRRPSSRPPPARPATIQIQVQRRPGSPSSTPLLPKAPASIMIPTTASSSLSQPTSPGSRSPSPTSSSSSSGSTISRTPSPTSPSSSSSRSRSPSPTASSPHSPSLEDLLELHSRSASPSPERGSIV